MNSIICVHKMNGRVRICLDPFNLNKAVLHEHFAMNAMEDIVPKVHGSQISSTLDVNMACFKIVTRVHGNQISSTLDAWPASGLSFYMAKSDISIESEYKPLEIIMRKSISSASRI